MVELKQNNSIDIGYETDVCDIWTSELGEDADDGLIPDDIELSIEQRSSLNWRERTLTYWILPLNGQIV